jgi:hypothetical protein
LIRDGERREQGGEGGVLRGAPEQNVFERIRDKLARLYLDAIDGPVGVTHAQDAAALLGSDTIRAGSVDLLVTSPPYLQVVNYGTANWIRLWLLGVDDVGREQGEGRRTLDAALDHRHTYSSYKTFMLRIFHGGVVGQFRMCVAGGQCESSAGRPQARGLPRRVAFAANGCPPALDTDLAERRDHVVGG